MERWLAAFIAFLCRILKSFNIGWVNEIAESLRPWKEQNRNDNIYAEHCQVSFQMAEQKPTLRSHLDKFDLPPHRVQGPREAQVIEPWKKKKQPAKKKTAALENIPSIN